ncbi:MAG: hypothetical protein JSS35_02685 [Proteobacteria bacterium]|nr:hypothetical protein [Pseudomonadota bacterium]
MNYSYYELRLKRDPSARQALADHVHATLGDRVVAVFAPLLGFASNQALVLTDEAAPSEAVMRAPGVLSADRHVLKSTIRPADGARPAPLGVYVHNWFSIDEGGLDEFVRLSGEAWPDFEGHFETRVFGLFAAEPTQADMAEGARRLLLMTGYRDLNEWQKSRNATPIAREAFMRRRQLTRVSLARATVLAPRA